MKLFRLAAAAMRDELSGSRRFCSIAEDGLHYNGRPVACHWTIPPAPKVCLSDNFCLFPFSVIHSLCVGSRSHFFFKYSCFFGGGFTRSRCFILFFVRIRGGSFPYCTTVPFFYCLILQAVYTVRY